MSTHATVKIVVRQRTDGMDLEPEVSTARLMQYADGMEDFVRPHMETALKEVAAMAIPDEITADTVAATYEALINEPLKSWQSSMVRLVTQNELEAQRARWQWLVEVDVERFTDTVTWRIIGGSDFN